MSLEVMRKIAAGDESWKQHLLNIGGPIAGLLLASHVLDGGGGARPQTPMLAPEPDLFPTAAPPLRPAPQYIDASVVPPEDTPFRITPMMAARQNYQEGNLQRGGQNRAQTQNPVPQFPSEYPEREDKVQQYAHYQLGFPKEGMPDWMRSLTVWI